MECANRFKIKIKYLKFWKFNYPNFLGRGWQHAFKKYSFGTCWETDCSSWKIVISREKRHFLPVRNWNLKLVYHLCGRSSWMKQCQFSQNHKDRGRRWWQIWDYDITICMWIYKLYANRRIWSENPVRKTLFSWFRSSASSTSDETLEGGKNLTTNNSKVLEKIRIAKRKWEWERESVI